MPQFFQDNIPLLQRDTGTQISMPATYNGQLARARVAGQGYRWSSALACNLATTGLGGLDTGSLAANTLYHVYLCVSSNIVGLVVSANGPSVGPTGFSQNRYVGRLRTQSGSANVAELAVVNVIVGSGDAQGAAVTDLGTYTPTFTSSGATNMALNVSINTLRIFRNGSNLRIQGTLRKDTNSPGGTTSNPIFMSLPSGLTPTVPTGTEFTAGHYNRYSTTYDSVGPVLFITSSSGLQFGKTGGAGYQLASDFVANSYWYISVEIPITEWQGLFS